MSSLFPNQVIVSAHLTEKASLVGQYANTYVFKVASESSKLEIKKAIENKFNVTVTKVNLLNVKGKMKRGGKGKLTKKSNWKKCSRNWMGPGYLYTLWCRGIYLW